MRRRPAVSQLIKWIGTGLALLIMAGFVASSRWVVTWTSRDTRHELDLLLGAVNYAWAPPSWSAQDQRYPPQPGMEVGTYGDYAPFVWWIERGEIAGRYWVAVPLWISFAVVALPSGMLWYRNRRSTAEAIRPLLAALTPREAPRLSLRAVVIFFIMHVVVMSVLFTVFVKLFDHNGPRSVSAGFANVASVILFDGAPAWAVLWAVAYVRLRRHLLRRDPTRCSRCGYNLTGNTSGRCPECGTEIVQV